VSEPSEDRGGRKATKKARGLGGGAVRAAERAGGEALHRAEHAGAGALHAADVLRREPFWQAQAVLVGALILYLTLPSKFLVGPSWLMPGLELLLVAGLWFDRPRATRAQAQRERQIVLVLLALVAVANLVQLELLVHFLLHGGKAGGRPLLLSSIVIWLTNLAVFALWYWQLDRGGPDARAREADTRTDFVFPEMTETDWAPQDWSPTFLDYLYVSFTNATAFSPTDTMPVSLRSKMLMMAQAIISLVTVLLVAARAINVLS
jgi:uncharacterized membrane protein